MQQVAQSDEVLRNAGCIASQLALGSRLRLGQAAWCKCWEATLHAERRGSHPSAVAAQHPRGWLCKPDASTSLHCTVPSGRKAELCNFPNKLSAPLEWHVELHILPIVCGLLLLSERDHFPLLQRRHWPQKLTELPAWSPRAHRALEPCFEMHNWNTWAGLCLIMCLQLIVRLEVFFFVH